MPRRVTFIGNCQAQTVAKLYQDVVAPKTHDTVDYVASYESVDATKAATIAEADILVRQVLDFAPQSDVLRSNARTVLMPLVSAPFLWPCSGTPHPKNAPAPYLDEAGPYGAELGDSHLNRAIVRGVPAGLTVAAYLTIDLAAEKNVDRMREIVLEKQQARDRACGHYNFARLFETRLASEKMFRTVNHPERGLTYRLAQQVFERIGVAAELIADVSAYSGPLFPATEAPIHPSIIRHFGLTYADQDTRYCFYDEGGYTFEEYAGRYMDYVWNADLPRGIHLAHHGEASEAVAVLKRAVAESPGSAVGFSVLGDLLQRCGDIAEAVSHARRAADLAPENQHYAHRLRHLQSVLTTTISA